MGFISTIWHNWPFKSISNLETSEKEFDLLLDSGAGMEGKMEGKMEGISSGKKRESAFRSDSV